MRKFGEMFRGHEAQPSQENPKETWDSQYTGVGSMSRGEAQHTGDLMVQIIKKLEQPE